MRVRLPRRLKKYSINNLQTHITDRLKTTVLYRNIAIQGYRLLAVPTYRVIDYLLTNSDHWLYQSYYFSCFDEAEIISIYRSYLSHYLEHNTQQYLDHFISEMLQHIKEVVRLTKLSCNSLIRGERSIVLTKDEILLRTLMLAPEPT